MVTLPTPVRMRQRTLADALAPVREPLILLISVLLTLSVLVALSTILGHVV